MVMADEREWHERCSMLLVFATHATIPA